MGTQTSKLTEKERITIYRRVTLDEARKRFVNLSPERKRNHNLLDYPVSRNFSIEKKGKILHLLPLKENEEVSGRPNEYETDRRLIYLLSEQIAWYGNLIVGDLSEPLKVGLNKQQYDALFSSCD